LKVADLERSVRPQNEWPRPAHGRGVAMMTPPLDVCALLDELA
jgi:hypothetical protein